MKQTILLILFLMCEATAALGKKIELQVKLLDSIPSTTQYTWWTAAKASSSCEWNGASSGTSSGTGSGTITGNMVDIDTETRSQTSSQGSSECRRDCCPGHDRHVGIRRRRSEAAAARRPNRDCNLQLQIQLGKLGQQSSNKISKLPNLYSEYVLQGGIQRQQRQDIWSETKCRWQRQRRK
jgi:hypothetical protein